MRYLHVFPHFGSSSLGQLTIDVLLVAVIVAILVVIMILILMVIIMLILVLILLKIVDGLCVGACQSYARTSNPFGKHGEVI